MKKIPTIDDSITHDDIVFNVYLDEFSKRQDQIFIEAISKHIPEVNLQNINEYADRVTVILPDFKIDGTQPDYPKTIWLDFPGPNQVKCFTLYEPEVVMDDKVNMRFKQDYVIY